MHGPRDEHIEPTTPPGVPPVAPKIEGTSVPIVPNESPLTRADGTGIDSLIRKIIRESNPGNPSGPPFDLEAPVADGSSFEHLIDAQRAELKQAPQSVVILAPNQMIEIRGLKLAVCDLDMTLLKTEEYHDGPHGRFAYSVRSALEELGHRCSDEKWELYWQGDKTAGDQGLAAVTYPSVEAMAHDIDRRLVNVLEDVGHPLPAKIYDEVRRVKDQLSVSSDPLESGPAVKELGAYIRQSLKEEGTKYSKIDWEWLWDGEAALLKHGFRSASGQSEDDVFSSLVKMTKQGLHVDLNADQEIAGDENLEGHEPKGVERLRQRNATFIEDHFDSHHHLIEVIHGARGLIDDVRASGGKLGLCTASGNTFVRKLMEVAERDEFGEFGQDGSRENKFRFLKSFDYFKMNAAKRIGTDEYNGAPVEDLCKLANVDPRSAGMFGDGTNDFGTASEAGLPIVVLALNSDDSRHIESANRIVDQVEAAVKKSPGLVSKTTLVIALNFEQVLIRKALEGERGLRWKIGTREELEPGS